VVDHRGELVAYARPDGIVPSAAVLALRKAVTAACNRTATAVIQESMSGSPARLIAFHAVDGWTLFGGGVPIVVRGATIGGVGVSGGNESLDTEVAAAAVREVFDGAELPEEPRG
jgi:uncharacterized protein GlcG (DUF336 family)